MLTQIEILGFKAIRHSGPIALGPLTLLIGRNGSGKSSLIEALQWLQEAVLGGLLAATQRRFDSFEVLVNRSSKAEVIALRLVHGARSQEVRYGLEVVGRGKLGVPVVYVEQCREVRANGRVGKVRVPKGGKAPVVRSVEEKAGSVRWTIRSRTDSKTPGMRSIEGGNPVRDVDALALAFVTKTRATGAERLLEYLREAVFLRLSPTAMARGGRLVPTTRGPKLDEEGRDLVALLGELDAEQSEQVRARVAQIIAGVEGIEVVSQGGSEGYFQTRERMQVGRGKHTFAVPSWMTSEGTRRITAIFALLAVRPRPSLIAIEEIENGLDPWTLRVVMDALREASSEGVQVLLTTHSPFLLDHVQPDEVLHVRRAGGETVYERMTSFEEVVRYQRVVPPGAMYIGGYMRDAEPAES